MFTRKWYKKSNNNTLKSEWQESIVVVSLYEQWKIKEPKMYIRFVFSHHFFHFQHNHDHLDSDFSFRQVLNLGEGKITNTWLCLKFGRGEEITFKREIFFYLHQTASCHIVSQWLLKSSIIVGLDWGNARGLWELYAFIVSLVPCKA